MKRVCALAVCLAWCSLGCQDTVSIAAANGCGVDIEVIEKWINEHTTGVKYGDVPAGEASQVLVASPTWSEKEFLVRAKGAADPGRVVEVKRDDTRRDVGGFDYVFEVKGDLCPV